MSIYRTNERPMQIKIQLTHDEVTEAVVKWLTDRKRVHDTDVSSKQYELQMEGEDGDHVCMLIIDLGDQSGI